MALSSQQVTNRKDKIIWLWWGAGEEFFKHVTWISKEYICTQSSHCRGAVKNATLKSEKKELFNESLVVS
jgi:hypothetical protein